jgi:hypothetical protein
MKQISQFRNLIEEWCYERNKQRRIFETR